ncbi:MAG: encapsulin-associated ferritin-like protein [Candidatus Sericytochromatia bacterium]
MEYHEPWEQLDTATRDYHRAIKSLMEELEAVDWYHQRVVTCTDPDLKRILEHNRDEEMEHACMALEWLRRKMPGWDENLRTYLFQDPAIPVVEIEEHATGKAEGGASSAPAASNAGDLGIGSLKED